MAWLEMGWDCAGDPLAQHGICSTPEFARVRTNLGSAVEGVLADWLDSNVSPGAAPDYSYRCMLPLRQLLKLSKEAISLITTVSEVKGLA